MRKKGHFPHHSMYFPALKYIPTLQWNVSSTSVDILSEKINILKLLKYKTLEKSMKNIKGMWPVHLFSFVTVYKMQIFDQDRNLI